MKTHYLAIILIILFTYMKITSSKPIPEPQPKPCMGLLLSLIRSIKRSFGGYGGPLGPGFVSSPAYGGYYPGTYYGAPYYPYYPYPYYSYPYYPYPGPINQGPFVPGGPILVTTTTTDAPIIVIGK